MVLHELKNDILNNNFKNNFYIFLYKKDTFLVHQYINKLIELYNFTVLYINSIQDTLNLNFLFDTNKNLNILFVDKFEEYFEDYSKLNNCIVICNEIDKKIINVVKPYIVEFIEPTEVHLEEFVQRNCNGLDKNEIIKLCKLTNYNTYTLYNELCKINIFPVEKQKNILNSLINEDNSFLFNLTIFDLTTALLTNNNNSIITYFKHAAFCSFEPLVIVSILIKNFKNILLIKYSNITSTELNISDKQYNFILRTPYNISEYKIIEILKFLSDIDFKLKSGNLELSSNLLIEYIINKIIYIYNK